MFPIEEVIIIKFNLLSKIVCPVGLTEIMRETYPGTWPLMITTLIFVVFLANFLLRKKKNVAKGIAYKLPPGRSGWPLIGDSFSWYKAVASSHPPKFVEEQVKRSVLIDFNVGKIVIQLRLTKVVLMVMVQFSCRFGKIFSCSLFGKWAVVSADPTFNKFVMQNEGKLFQSSYPKSFRDLVGKNGVITVQGEQQRKLHAIASNMMRLDKLKFHFLEDIQKVMLQTLGNLYNNQVIHLQDVCRKASNEFS